MCKHIAGPSYKSGMHLLILRQGWLNSLQERAIKQSAGCLVKCPGLIKIIRVDEHDCKPITVYTCTFSFQGFIFGIYSDMAKLKRLMLQKWTYFCSRRHSPLQLRIHVGMWKIDNR